MWLSAGMAVTLLAFDVLWCAGTSFRAMSDVALYVNALAAAALLSLPYALTRRMWVQIAVMVSVDALLMANLMYCRTYFDAIPPASYLLAGNLRDFGDSVTASLRLTDWLLPLLTVATWLMARRRSECPLTRRQAAVYAGVTAVLCSASVLIAVCRGGFRTHIDKLLNSCYYHTAPAPVYTVFGYLAYRITEPEPEFTPEAEARISGWLAEHERLMPYRALPDSVAGRRSLVIVLCESLESWPIGRTVEGQELTPYINSLVARPTTLYAPNVLTQVDAGRSIDCQLLVNAGMHPTVGKVYSMTYPENRYYTLNQAVTEHGGRSYLLTPDKPVTWNTAAISRAFGIDTLVSQGDYVKDETIGSPAKLSDGSFMRQSVAKMRSGEIWPVGETAFVMLITYSGHFPFKIPDNLSTLRLAGDYPERLRDYMRMAHYVDAQLRTLVEYIEGRPDAAGTLVVITGDHEGLAGDRADIVASAAGARLVSQGQYTPLIVLNSPVGGRYEPVMGQVDIYTTLLNLMHLDRWPWRGMGRSIVGPEQPRWAVAGLTNEIAGDTLADTPRQRAHQRAARGVSDAIITHDYFGREGLRD